MAPSIYELKWQPSNFNSSILLLSHHEKNRILQLGHLFFQQYCVDQFAKVHSTRLQYVRNNQATLRRDLYNLLQYFILIGDTDRAGRRYILPNSFTGSLRYMDGKHYQGVKVIVKKFGKLTLFFYIYMQPKLT